MRPGIQGKKFLRAQDIQNMQKGKKVYQRLRVEDRKQGEGRLGIQEKICKPPLK